ncbi:MAG: GTPase HflX [Bacteroidia bacterium]|nr:GTPase HflX [Bacteroidia bacterium]MDW8346284.1 GTPase HflX [Bacteroidia bacterium]
MERAVLVGVMLPNQRKEQIQEYLDELAFLADTAGAQTQIRFIQSLLHPDPRTFINKGKAEEIKNYVREHKIDLVIFDDTLSPSQTRNLESLFNTQEIDDHKCKVLDRNGLILDIFAKRAKTAQAKTQVELAQLQYLLPRLTGMWTHLQKQKGGIGMKGPGEKELETDRRLIRTRISKLKDELKHIDRQNITRRRHRTAITRIALVGYTNAGKSTLMNVLTKANVFAENKLFATLDTTVRKVVWEQIPFLISDTVGFIRKLPHQLVECFKSTLDEVREADMLLHVIDISHPQYQEHIRVVQQTLAEIGAGNKYTLQVFNKIDVIQNEMTLTHLQESYIGKENSPSVFISAHEKINIDLLRQKIITFGRNLRQT